MGPGGQRAGPLTGGRLELYDAVHAAQGMLWSSPRYLYSAKYFVRTRIRNEVWQIAASLVALWQPT
jgi:hypothetical protein